jgi:hypothetical protein
MVGSSYSQEQNFQQLIEDTLQNIKEDLLKISFEQYSDRTDSEEIKKAVVDEINLVIEKNDSKKILVNEDYHEKLLHDLNSVDTQPGLIQAFAAGCTCGGKLSMTCPCP